MPVAEDLTQFVLRDLAARRGVTSLDAHDDLLGKGIVDSLGITELIAFLEERYGVDVRPEDIVPENFRTLANIEAFVERRR